MRLHSIRARLLIASALLLPVFLGVAGLGLERAFRQALRVEEEQQLKLQSYLLLGAAELEGGTIVLPDALPEPRYGQIGSGLYAQIRDARGEVVWRSRSGELLRLEPRGGLLGPGAESFGEGSAGEQSLFVYRYGFAWETETGGEVPFELAVWHDQAPYHAKLAGYRRSLLQALGLVAVLLLALQLALLQWGLRPLRRLADDLERVQEGEVQRLAADYPSEVEGVTENLNRLLASEQGRRDRYRNTLSNLAHSLKTPLAVLRGALETGASPDELRARFEEELTRMEGIVAHQLTRAQRRGERPVGASAAVAPVVERLSAALEKVYRDKSPRFSLTAVPGCVFRGDEGDLMEMLGNLLDNCCKYGGPNIRIDARRAGRGLRIEIADDGPGIAPEERERIRERGVRADLRAPGHGIGLAMVDEIATSYGGHLTIDDAPDGGARFVLEFP